MPKSAFDYQTDQSSGGAWTMPWSPGAGLSSLFALYPSKGDVTISGATSLPTMLDGPIQVARYGALTVNAALTVSNRCRGLVILADSLSMGASGVISMTARGAAGSPKWASQDIGVPTGMVLSGKNTGLKAFLDWLAYTGYCIFDPSLFAAPVAGMGDVQADWASWPTKMSPIVSVAGCAACKTQAQTSPGVGVTGNAGSNGGTGGGGLGGWFAQGPALPAPGMPGRVWGGGPGSNGINDTQTLPADPWGGQGGKGTTAASSGGGAGNPSGNNVSTSNGTGGLLLAIIRNNVLLTAGHKLEANGMPGESAVMGGGGSGAGSAGLFYGGTLTGTPNLVAIGGTAGGGSTAAGGAGGAGSTQSKTFTQMGWS